MIPESFYYAFKSDVVQKTFIANNKIDATSSNGPGKLSQALGIKTDHDKKDLLGDEIWIEDRNMEITESQIVSSTRIGVDYAGEDAKLPWRFHLKATKWISKKHRHKKTRWSHRVLSRYK